MDEIWNLKFDCYVTEEPCENDIDILLFKVCWWWTLKRSLNLTSIRSMWNIVLERCAGVVRCSLFVVRNIADWQLSRLGNISLSVLRGTYFIRLRIPLLIGDTVNKCKCNWNAVSPYHPWILDIQTRPSTRSKIQDPRSERPVASSNYFPLEGKQFNHLHDVE